MAEESGEKLMQDFYEKYYTAVATSQANAVYCQRLYGRNMCQHGFAEIAHIDHLIRVLGVHSGSRVLDMGCGNGLISEYIAGETSAHVTGIDFIGTAIEQARERTAAKRELLDFWVMDMGHMDFPPQSFDAIISIDTFYFISLPEALRNMRRMLKPRGRIVSLFSQSSDDGRLSATYPRETVLPDNTDLAVALREYGFSYRTWDYTEADFAHARRKRAITVSLREQFAAEGNVFLYENHLGEANGVIGAYEAGAHGRYLYLAK